MQYENDGLFKVDEKSIRTKEFINILTEMILNYNQPATTSEKIG